MIVWLILCVVIMVGGAVTGQRQYGHPLALFPIVKVFAIRSIAQNKALAAVPAKPRMSWAASEVLDEYNALPEAHRPSMDIEAALRALDVKYGIGALNSHFQDDSGYWNADGSWDCWCKGLYDTKWDEYVVQDDIECQDYPEFDALREEISKIKWALIEREQAEKAYQRKLEIAGVESDLRSIEDITAALRMERQVISEVTKEVVDYTEKYKELV